MSNRGEIVKKKPSQKEIPLTDIADAGINAASNGTVPKEAIQQLAYLKWEAAGKPCCDGTTFWEQAEQELLQGK